MKKIILISIICFLFINGFGISVLSEELINNINSVNNKIVNYESSGYNDVEYWGLVIVNVDQTLDSYIYNFR